MNVTLLQMLAIVMQHAIIQRLHTLVNVKMASLGMVLIVQVNK